MGERGIVAIDGTVRRTLALEGSAQMLHSLSAGACPLRVEPPGPLAHPSDAGALRWMGLRGRAVESRPPPVPGIFVDVV